MSDYIRVERGQVARTVLQSIGSKDIMREYDTKATIFSDHMILFPDMKTVCYSEMHKHPLQLPKMLSSTLITIKRFPC